MTLVAEIVKAVMLSKGYTVFEDPKGYDLNLFGVRTADVQSNTFNDWVGVMYVSEGVWNFFAFPATTDPGLYWRLHPMNVDGTAILKPGQYRGAYKYGIHRGYPALQQQRDVVVYRDNDRDNYLHVDEDTTEKGIFGINIHRASSKAPSKAVDRWSAGCQVLQDPIHFAFLIELVRKSTSIYGNSLTYTLLTENDFTGGSDPMSVCGWIGSILTLTGIRKPQPEPPQKLVEEKPKDYVSEVKEARHDSDKEIDDLSRDDLVDSINSEYD